MAVATVAQCAHRAPLGNSNGTCGDSALRCLEKEIEKLPQTLGACAVGLALVDWILHPPVLPGLDRYPIFCGIKIHGS